MRSYDSLAPCGFRRLAFLAGVLSGACLAAAQTAATVDEDPVGFITINEGSLASGGQNSLYAVDGSYATLNSTGGFGTSHAVASFSGTYPVPARWNSGYFKATLKSSHVGFVQAFLYNPDTGQGDDLTDSATGLPYVNVNTAADTAVSFSITPAQLQQYQDNRGRLMVQLRFVSSDVFAFQFQVDKAAVQVTWSQSDHYPYVSELHKRTLSGAPPGGTPVTWYTSMYNCSDIDALPSDLVTFLGARNIGVSFGVPEELSGTLDIKPFHFGLSGGTGWRSPLGPFGANVEGMGGLAMLSDPNSDQTHVRFEVGFFGAWKQYSTPNPPEDGSNVLMIVVKRVGSSYTLVTNGSDIPPNYYGSVFNQRATNYDQEPWPYEKFADGQTGTRKYVKGVYLREGEQMGADTINYYMLPARRYLNPNGTYSYSVFDALRVDVHGRPGQ